MQTADKARQKQNVCHEHVNVYNNCKSGENKVTDLHQEENPQNRLISFWNVQRVPENWNSGGRGTPTPLALKVGGEFVWFSESKPTKEKHSENRIKHKHMTPTYQIPKPSFRAGRIHNGMPKARIAFLCRRNVDKIREASLRDMVSWTIQTSA